VAFQSITLAKQVTHFSCMCPLQSVSCVIFLVNLHSTTKFKGFISMRIMAGDYL
jgi:hypothetical protein